MGDAKRRREAIDQIAAKVTVELMNRGLIVEAGWAIMSSLLDDKLPLMSVPAQREMLRLCFLAGAEHLWSSINAGLDTDKEPTDADLRRMALLHSEIAAVRSMLCQQFGVEEWLPAAPTH